MRYSVIIPTMWACDNSFEKMIANYDKCEEISEIIIIDNLPQAKRELKSDRLKIVSAGHNLFVNPAWNLGVSIAKEENVIIANDDIYIKPKDLKALLKVKLKKGMIIGAGKHCFKKRGLKLGKLEIKKQEEINWGFGVFMMIKKNSYVVVPEYLKIWEGDVLQCDNNDIYSFNGIEVKTDMSTTIKKFNLLEEAKKEPIKKRCAEDITLIIKTFERPEHLKRLIKSIRDYYEDIKIIVADDSQDELELDGVEYHKLPYNVGLSAGRNFLISKVKTKYFVLLDDDFIFTEKTNLKLWREQIEKSGMDILGGQVILNNEKQDCFGSLEGDGEVVKYTRDVNDKGFYKECDIILNFFIAKTKSFDGIGWDEYLKITEHFDFFWAIKGKLKVGYTEDISIDHSRHGEFPISERFTENRKKRKDYFPYILKKHNIKKLVTFYDTIEL